MKINSEVKVIGSIVIVCVLLLGAFIFFAPDGTPSIARDLSLLVREDSYMTGNIDAKVTLVEFADFQCPACASVAPYIKRIVDVYKDNPDFNFVFRHLPLPQHANAVISAEAVESAGVQGKFFEMAELVYQNQTSWSSVKNPTDLFVGYATTLGLDITKFKSDLESNKFESFIKADLADANALALNHTPFIFLNGVEVNDLQTLQAQIDSALAGE